MENITEGTPAEFDKQQVGSLVPEHALINNPDLSKYHRVLTRDERRDAARVVRRSKTEDPSGVKLKLVDQIDGDTNQTGDIEPPSQPYDPMRI